MFAGVSDCQHDDADHGRHRGDPVTAEWPDLVYAHLKAIARQKMAGERRDHTLQPTALVHEAWLRLPSNFPEPEDPSRFLRLSARVMHQVLIDHARARGRVKRSPVVGERVPLSAEELSSHATPEEILAVEDAICRLEEQDPRMGEVARLRVFAGFEEVEAAEALGVSRRTLRRCWSFARAWLQKELGE